VYGCCHGKGLVWPDVEEGREGKKLICIFLILPKNESLFEFQEIFWLAKNYKILL